MNYGLVKHPNKFEANKNYCTLYTKLAVAYALAICKVGKAKSIFFVGFDGYVNDKPKNTEMTQLINFFTKKFKKLKLFSLTPTIYPAKKITF